MILEVILIINSHQIQLLQCLMLALVLFDFKGPLTCGLFDQLQMESHFYLIFSEDACIHSFTCIINIYGFKFIFLRILWQIINYSALLLILKS